MIQSFITRKIPFFYFIIFVLAGSLAWLMYMPVQYVNSSITENENLTTGSGELQRFNGFKFIGPLLLKEEKNKSPKYNRLVNEISLFIDQKKKEMAITGASLYLHDTGTGEWTGFDEDERYNPGSLMKVPELISVLKMEEEKPGILNKKYFYQAPFITQKATAFTSRNLEPGKSYSVKELLKYMIEYSDNNATILLDLHLDQRIFNKLLTDLQLPLPVKGAPNYPISARQYSLFMHTIYNASYLNIQHSEYAADLLSRSDFNAGFKSAFPSPVKMIHKFGEAGNQIEHQLHESGIIYLNEKPFILTIMTRGKDINLLPGVIGGMASIVKNNPGQ